MVCPDRVLTSNCCIFREPLNNVTSAAKTRQKRAKNRSLLCVNEDFEPVFNAVFASAVVIQRFLSNDYTAWCSAALVE